MAHSMLHKIELTPNGTLALARRWTYWHPWCKAAIRNMLGVTIESLSYVHYHRVLTCLRLGIPWRTIKISRLDDPRPSEEVFYKQLAEALERRRYRQLANPKKEQSNDFTRNGN